MKRYLFLSLLILSAMTSYAYDAYVGGIYYNLVSKAKQATVTNNGDDNNGCYSGDVVIPSTFTYGGITYTVTGIANNAFAYSSLTSVKIANSVTSIDEKAFFSCSSLSSIDISNSVTSIGNSAFQYCSNLSSVSIPNSVTSIGSQIFEGCSSLTSVTLSNSLTSIPFATFSYCTSLTTISIPNSVTDIWDNAFSGCSSLTSINIPSSVTNLGSYAFHECKSLASILIPSSVTTINSGVFYGCEALTSVEIPNTVGSIGDQTFYNCINLTDVILGNSINYIGNEAFANCQNLENVYCYKVFDPSTMEGYFYTNSNAFDGSYTEYATLYVPAESLSEYRTTAPWSNFGTLKPLTPPTPENIDLVDGVDYTNTKEKACNTLTYTRSFSNTDWQALYVPFGMNYADWSADFEIARLNDVHQFDDDEDGDVDRTVLESIKLKAGSSVEPHTPYLIKAKTTGTKTIRLTNTTLYGAKENSFDVTSWNTRFNFTGTYHEVTNMASAGHYAMSDGGLKQATSDAATLGAYRWYLDITDRYGNPAAGRVRKVFLSFDDGESTEIKVVEANDADSNSGAIYSVSGVNVGNNKARLSKGLYVRNGKKFIIK